jgi:hypothetical protein
MEVEQQMLKADGGSKSAIRRLEQHYTWDESDFEKVIAFFRKFPPSNNTAKFMFARALTNLEREGSNYDEGINILEQMAFGKSDLSFSAIDYLTELYLKAGNIPKALFFAKLEVCQYGEKFSWQPYINLVSEHFPHDKNHMKLAFAMMVLSAERSGESEKAAYYNTIERNFSYLYNKDEREYIKTNYNKIISEECATTLSESATIATMNKSLFLKNDYNAPSSNIPDSENNKCANLLYR